MNLTNASLFSIESYEYQKEELNLYYAICEVLVAVFAVVGNALVIVVFQKERRLRRRTNYYIVSLAVADFLVGLLGIPFAIMSSIGLPTNLHACLFTVSLLLVLCTISIFCLVAVSVDRYWAILYPMGYSRNVRTKTAIEKSLVASQIEFKAKLPHSLTTLNVNAAIKKVQSLSLKCHFRPGWKVTDGGWEVNSEVNNELVSIF